MLCHFNKLFKNELNGLIVRSVKWVEIMRGVGGGVGDNFCTLLALYVSACVKALGLSHSILHLCSLHLRFALYTFLFV